MPMKVKTIQVRIKASLVFIFPLQICLNLSHYVQQFISLKEKQRAGIYMLAAA
jgi:hypothetical protein